MLPRHTDMMGALNKMAAAIWDYLLLYEYFLLLDIIEGLQRIPALLYSIYWLALRLGTVIAFFVFWCGIRAHPSQPTTKVVVPTNRPVLTTFAPFLDLPVELRQMIWKLFDQNEPRHIHVGLRPALKFPRIEDNYEYERKWHLETLRTRTYPVLPLILQVCQESRNQGFLKYTASFHPIFRLHADEDYYYSTQSRGPIYLDPSVDSLIINVEYCYTDMNRNSVLERYGPMFQSPSPTKLSWCSYEDPVLGLYISVKTLKEKMSDRSVGQDSGRLECGCFECRGVAPFESWKPLPGGVGFLEG